jgi:uncharacterized lipoprotein YddW (UPF0748 family)
MLMLCLILVGCGLHSDEDNPTLDINEGAVFDDKLDDTTNIVGDEDSFIFTWLTYSELQVTDSRKNRADYEKYIDSLFVNMSSIGVTDCFVQVRPFADAIYESRYYPLSLYANKAEDFDVFESIISVAEKYSIDIHAWVNPYRISYKSLQKYSIWNNDYKSHIITLSSGTYFLPSSLKAQKLILSGIDEILTKYDVKGIHIDDYFYPEDINDEDKKDYEKYKKSGGKKDLASYRRENVNSLVSAIYLRVKAFGEDKIFSVSPAGNIDKSYNQLYADVYSWCKGGYCDIILPQIYFGFSNQTMPFEKCLDRWLSITDSEKVILIPALALYKSGKEDIFAGRGKAEWQENNDIISRQVSLIKDKAMRGFALYSSSYINFSETFIADELNNLKSML